MNVSQHISGHRRSVSVSEGATTVDYVEFDESAEYDTVQIIQNADGIAVTPLIDGVEQCTIAIEPTDMMVQVVELVGHDTRSLEDDVIDALKQVGFCPISGTTKGDESNMNDSSNAIMGKDKTTEGED